MKETQIQINHPVKQKVITKKVIPIIILVQIIKLNLVVIKVKADRNHHQVINQIRLLLMSLVLKIMNKSQKVNRIQNLSNNKTKRSY